MELVPLGPDRILIFIIAEWQRSIEKNIEINEMYLLLSSVCWFRIDLRIRDTKI